MPNTPTNIEIRRWYYEQAAKIQTLNQQWTIEDVPLVERAKRAYTFGTTCGCRRGR